MALSLFTCEEIEDDFDFGVVPGDYEGSLTYFTANQGGGIDINLPELSKTTGYRVSIANVGTGHRLSFDKSFKYEVPDIDVVENEYYSKNSASIVSIRTIDGQPYTTVVMQTYPGVPSSYFYVDEVLRNVKCILTLKSNNPDSVYYLDISVLRKY